MKIEKSFLLAGIICLLMPSFSFSQSTTSFADSAQGVQPLPIFGGRINGIAGAAIDNVTTRVFVTTQSANSIMYFDVDHSGSSPTFGDYQSVPDFDTDDNYGSGLQAIVADESGFFYVVNQGQLLSASAEEGSVTEIESNGVLSAYTYDNRLFYVTKKGPDYTFYFGDIDADGNYSAGGNTTVANSDNSQNVVINVDALTDSVFVFFSGNTPQIWCMDSTYNTLITNNTNSKIALASEEIGNYDFGTFGVANDGRMIMIALKQEGFDQSKFMAWTDDHITWDTLDTGFGGVVGPKLLISDEENYNVYNGSGYGLAKGESTWQKLGTSGQDTNPNDGDIAFDPNNPLVVYMTTDIGLAYSLDGGATIADHVEGMTAVQVNDFDMSHDFAVGWAASKSGIRQLELGLETNVFVHWPNGDGSPYYSIAVDTLSVSDGSVVFAGNTRLYKSTNSGSNWSQPFTTENGDYGFNFGAYVASIAVSPVNPDVMLLGINSPAPENNGGLFYSTDAGDSWTQVDTSPYKVEVTDILAMPRGDTTLFYVASEYNDGAYAVKEVRYQATDGFSFLGTMTSTSTDGFITNFGATAFDFDSDSTVYVTGTKGAGNEAGEPRVYRLDASNTWTQIASAGLPETGRATALTFDPDDDIYLAINNDLYTLDAAGTGSWSLYYSYPNGTEVNFLFWDELFVGTGTGVYVHKETAGVFTERTTSTSHPKAFALEGMWPNPSTSAATFKWRLLDAAIVDIRIFNVLGQEIATVAAGRRPAGVYQSQINIEPLTPGPYFIQVIVDGQRDMQQFIVVP